jgi:hypothetical protein
MIVVRATKDTEAGKMPEEKLIAAMATYHEELAKAGVLLDASGLQPTPRGWRVKYSGGKRTVIATGRSPRRRNLSPATRSSK